MRRALPIIVLFLLPWILDLGVPSLADEFKYRDFGITHYPGWTDGQLRVLGAVLAVITLGSMLVGLVLFERRPPPLFWPRALTWGVAFLHSLLVIAGAVLAHRWVNLPAYFAGLVLWYLFLSERMRFWRAEGGE